MAMAKIATIMPVGCAGCGANRQNAMKLMFAAAEAAVGLAMVIAVYRHFRSTNVDQLDRLKG